MAKSQESIAMGLSRPQLITVLAERVLGIEVKNRATVIGIDGVDLSGKTTLAGELKDSLERLSIEVVLIHEDNFLNPQRIRYQQGKWSVVGFYQDFFNFRSLASKILIPLHEGKNVDVEIQRVNSITDAYDSSVRYVVTRSCYAVVEGLFLLRPEFAGLFDLVVRLKISPQLVMARAMVRDVPRLGGEKHVRKHYSSQSIPAQELYERLYEPDLRADILIDNSDFANPAVIRTQDHQRTCRGLNRFGD